MDCFDFGDFVVFVERVEIFIVMYNVKGGRSIVCYFCFEEAKGVIYDSFRFEEHVRVVCVFAEYETY